MEIERGERSREVREQCRVGSAGGEKKSPHGSRLGGDLLVATNARNTEGKRVACRAQARDYSYSRAVEALLGGLGLEAIVGDVKARLVTVGGVLVEHALGNGLVDRRHGGLE